MNKGTVIRTIMAIALVINSGAIATGIAEFNDPVVDKWYKIVSFIATAVILFVNTYFNNDYTEEACIGTGYTRLLKEQKKIQNGEMIGEDFFSEGDNDGEHEDI